MKGNRVADIRLAIPPQPPVRRKDVALQQPNWASVDQLGADAGKLMAVVPHQ